MDSEPYIRVLVGNLAIKFLHNSNQGSSSSTIHPSSSSCFCKIKLSDFPEQTSTIPLIGEEIEDVHHSKSVGSPLAACFTLDKKRIEDNNYVLVIEVYHSGTRRSCWPWRSKVVLLGKIRVTLDLKVMENESRGYSLQNGWIRVGDLADVRLKVRAEADPRYVFEFGSSPENSPQVFKLNGRGSKQAVFTCKFSLRSSDRSLCSRASSMGESTPTRKWLPAFSGEWDYERKGWTVTVHDLSGSPVAMASMVTPFVPSPGSTRVTHSSPGAWLILQPDQGAWRPWGKLEAWRDRANSIGYRFSVFTDTCDTSSTLSTCSVSATRGGVFAIDTTNSIASPIASPNGSFDLGGASSLQHFSFKGFVMSASVAVRDKSRAVVEVGAQHVACSEDAAAFVALAAALDLSVEACALFSRKMRKELRWQIKERLVV